ncbi:MAG: phenylalanine--tRNA ligase subunit beta [Propionibacteriaceae bacterium]|nr:phenylalanine--tRNA ligase subunit beta [Propionibacteriaceae bacterium]
MKAPISWLRELVRLPAETTTAEIAEKFTALGLTVEHIEATGPEVTGPLVVGKVLSFTEEPQKNGKTIRYCRVDVGEHNDPATDELPASRGIVCGAHNFEEGSLVVVALPGAVLPGDFQIASRKTYGHISDGMICAEDELGLGSDHSGIMVLSPKLGLAPGDDALAALWTRDEVLDIDVTPDLGHCLSLRGLAREAATVHDVAYHDRYDTPMPEPIRAGYPIANLSDRCTAFVALTIEGFDPAAATPRFMVERLQAAGVRSISLPVDVTNYVMLESGQPLHAYDAEKLVGPIRVRLATAGEELTTLDGVRRKLDIDDLLITDDSGPIGLAGVMGGETTEVSENTSAIVLEAAAFSPASVSRTFRRHGLPSEASKRFERTVDPALPFAAARRAADLLVEHGGGRILDGFTVVGGVPAWHRIDMRAGLIPAILGGDISTFESIRVLEAGGCRVTALGDSLTVEVPTWRGDLRDPYDIVEEVGRKVGYHRIGRRMPIAPAGRGLTRTQQIRRAVMRAAAEAGFTEVLSLPFIGESDLDRMKLDAWDPRRLVVRLANPLAETTPFLRTSLLPGLFAAVTKNTSRSLDDLALFERGAVWYDRGGRTAPRPGVEQRPTADELAAIEAALPEQPEMIAAVVTGAWSPAGWHGPAVQADWRHVVAFAEEVCRAAGRGLERINAATAPWHPGRCAELLVDGKQIGHAGELHPDVIRDFGLPARTSAVEINLTALLSATAEPVRINQLTGFPLAKEDVALIVDEGTPAEAVRAALVEGAGDLLESATLFDVYRGDQVPQGKKSLAFALRFRADRTLTDAEAAEAREAAVAVASKQFGAVQRV